MKTRAAVLNEVGLAPPYAETKPLTIREVELDPPGPGEVLVKIAARGYATRIFRSLTATGPGRCQWRSAMRRPVLSRKSGRA